MIYRPTRIFSLASSDIPVMKRTAVCQSDPRFDKAVALLSLAVKATRKVSRFYFYQSRELIMSKHWFRTWFGKEYLDLYNHHDQSEADRQVSFVLDLLGEASSSVLDIACGSGRHVRAFLDHGIPTIGIDLSRRLVETAKQDGLRTVAQADMRKLPFGNCSFDLVTNFFTSFGYFSTDREHQLLLTEWRRVHKPGAFLVLDYLNRNFILTTLQGETLDENNKRLVIQRRQISADGKRVNKEITIKNKDSGKVSRYHESVRMYDLNELKPLLYSSGFSIEYIFGGFDGNTYSAKSKRLVVIAKAE